MRKNLNHARQFRFTVPRPKNADSKEILKWLYINLGKSSAMDLHNGVWFFDLGGFNQGPLYYFKHEQDAVYFKMTWESYQQL